MNLYRVILKDSAEHPRAMIFATDEADAREVAERSFGQEIVSVNFIREATPEELDIMAGGAPRPKH